MGLVNQIKNNLKPVGAPQQPPQQQAAPTKMTKAKLDDMMQIDSSAYAGPGGSQQMSVQNQLKMTAKQRSSGSKPVPVAQISLDAGNDQINSGKLPGFDVVQKLAERLTALKSKVYDKGNKQAHQDTVKTLFKVLENLQLKPTDMKVRSLPKTNKSVQEKILSHDDACAFLQLINFDFTGEQINLTSYDGVLIQFGLDAINDHIVSLGGSVAVQMTFDPTKSQRTLNTGEKLARPPGADETKYDPTKVSNMVDEEKRRR